MIVNFSRRVLAKLLNKRYRDAFVAENVRTGIAYQIRAMRDQRDSMSQKDLGDLMGKPQSVVSRLEDPEYGKPTVQTLLEVAAAFDVALLVQFVTHREFLRRMGDVSPNALKVDSFNASQLDSHPAKKQLLEGIVIQHAPLLPSTFFPISSEGMKTITYRTDRFGQPNTRWSN